MHPPPGSEPYGPDGESPLGGNPKAVVDAITWALDELPLDVARRSVVVLGGGSSILTWLRAGWPELHIRQLDADDPSLGLATCGPCAVIVDLQGPRRWRARLLTSFFHLAVGGRYVMRFDGENSPQRRAAADLVDRIRSGALTTAPEVPDMAHQTVGQRDLRYLAHAMRDAEVGGDVLTATQGLDVVLKVHDEDHDAVAAARGASSTTIEVVEARRLESRARLTLSARRPRNRFQTSFDAPAARLRMHQDVVCHDRQLVIQSGLVLPASFRRPHVQRMRNASLTDVAAGFGRTPTRTPGARLGGVYYHLDGEIPGHFGHAMTEVASRLWGWNSARERFPDIKVLLAAPPEGDYAPWFYDFLSAAGISPSDVEIFHGAVHVDRLVTASAMYSIGDFVHPAMLEVYEALGARLAVAAATAATGQAHSRVFFTRDSDRRGCRNRDEVEALFERHGFVVMRPESMSLPEQAAIVRGADCIAGFAGSNLLHLGLCGSPKQVVVVSSDTYHVSNEHQLSALVGHHLVVSTSKADVPRRGETFDGEAYRSTFAVDMADEGVFLDGALARLT